MTIIEMDKPKNCIYCPFRESGKHGQYCTAAGGKNIVADPIANNTINTFKPKWCPIITEVNTDLNRDEFLDYLKNEGWINF